MSLTHSLLLSGNRIKIKIQYRVFRCLVFRGEGGGEVSVTKSDITLMVLFFHHITTTLSTFLLLTGRRPTSRKPGSDAAISHRSQLHLSVWNSAESSYCLCPRKVSAGAQEELQSDH